MTLRQRIRRVQPGHTDDWLITYADTITLLLCLFVITLSIKTGARPPVPAAPPHAAQATAQEGIFWGPPAIRPFVPVIEAAAGEAAPVRLAPAAEISTDDTGGTEPAPATPRHIGSAVAATEMPVPAEPPAPARSGLPDIVARLMSRGTPVVGQSGDRITTLQIGSAAFFGSGSAALSNSGKAILSDVSVTLESREFASYHITIEGHTDDTPISTAQFQSNWELSAARAAAVARFLLELGVPARRLTASGFADTVPIVPNRNADGTVIAENQARNRRVVIRLEKIDKAER